MNPKFFITQIVCTCTLLTFQPQIFAQGTDPDTRPAPPSGPQNLRFIDARPVERLLLPFSGGNGTLTYALVDEHTLPDGFSFNSRFRILSGSLAGTNMDDSRPTQTYTYTATDEDGDTASATFTLTLDDLMPSFGESTIADISLIEGSSWAGITLPTATLGTRQNTYSLTPELPVGFTFDPSSRLLSGNPIQGLEETTFTYRATDEDRDFASLTFTISVEAVVPIAPSSMQEFTFHVGEAINETLTLFTSGNGDLTYALATSPALPEGLEFDATSNMLSGTILDTPVDDALPPTTYTYTATDEDGDSTSTTFTVEVVDVIPQAATVSDITVPPNGLILTRLPKFSYGTSLEHTLIYSLTNLPVGAVFESNNRIFVGIVTLSEARTVTYTATDGADSASVTFDLLPDFTPQAPEISDMDLTLFELFEEALPPFAGGMGALTYTLTPTLPVGLTFNPTTRTISGLPVRYIPSTQYSYAATDEDGNTGSISFMISVSSAALPLEGNNTPIPPAEQSFEFVRRQSVDVTLQPFTNGESALTYSLNTSPTLPLGLSFNSATRELTGTPEVALGPTVYTYTATDTNGNQATALFTLEVRDIEDISLEEITTNALPSIGANIAFAATQAISSRVSLALDGINQGIDIHNSEGQRFKLNTGGLGGSSFIRGGLWFSTSSDTLSSTRSNIIWNGLNDNTNVGIDLGIDISDQTSLVVGVMQNSSSTTTTYSDTNGDRMNMLGLVLDSTTFYVGIGFRKVDFWIANGSAHSALTVSAGERNVPTFLDYQSVGLTSSIDVSDFLHVGTNIELLTSDLTLSANTIQQYLGLQSNSSQLRMTLFFDFKFDLDDSGISQLIPKFEFGYRELSQTTSNSDTAPTEGASAETNLGIDYFHKELNLTIGLAIRSFDVEDYSSSSTQWHIRWESGIYNSGLSLQLKPNTVGESLGVERLYSSNYNQYQAILQKQYGGETQSSNQGLDFEIGYGFMAGTGTYTPFVRTTNFGNGSKSGRKAEEVGLRYSIPTGLDLTVKWERASSPETNQLQYSTIGVATHPLEQQENTITFSSSYNF